MFIRTESFRTFLKLYPVISSIVALHFILWLFISFFPVGRELLNVGIGFNYGLAQGEYWRLITAIFLHGGFGHVLFNSFSLVLFGPYLELLLKKCYFIFFYLTAGIIANIATYYLEPLQYLHLGASGAIFGLFGMYVYLALYRKDLIDRTNSQIVMTILIIGLIMTFTSSNINIIGHIFGLLGGAALSPIILKLKNI
jgi:rhomboid protease GluP